jgi:hypothetical protein
MLRQSVSSTAQREQVNSNTRQNVVADLLAAHVHGIDNPIGLSVQQLQPFLDEEAPLKALCATDGRDNIVGLG